MSNVFFTYFLQYSNRTNSRQMAILRGFVGLLQKVRQKTRGYIDKFFAPFFRILPESVKNTLTSLFKPSPYQNTPLISPYSLLFIFRLFFGQNPYSPIKFIFFIWLFSSFFMFFLTFSLLFLSFLAFLFHFYSILLTF